MLEPIVEPMEVVIEKIVLQFALHFPLNQLELLGVPLHFGCEKQNSPIESHKLGLVSRQVFEIIICIVGKRLHP